MAKNKKEPSEGLRMVMGRFNQVIQSPLCKGWALWSGDVPRGTPHVLMDRSAGHDEAIN